MSEKSKEKVKCYLCEYECSSNYLGYHLYDKHNITDKEKFYLEFLGNEKKACEVCKGPTKFVSLSVGYKKFCSIKCVFENEKMKNLKDGYTNVFQRPEIKEKMKQTNIKKYGCENPSQSEVIKRKKEETTFSHFGVYSPSQSKIVREKAKNTYIEKYGCINPGQNEEVKRKSRKTKAEKHGDPFFTNRKKAVETMMEKYGVSTAMHYSEFAEKALRNGGGYVSTRTYITKFGNKIVIQGGFEEKFVKWCEQNNLVVKTGPRIPYFFGIDRKYFCDFEVIKENKKYFVEIKGSYWYEKFKEKVDAKNLAAKKYAEENDAEFIFLIDTFSF